MLALLQASTPSVPINAVGGLVLAVSLLLTLAWVVQVYR